MIAALSWIGLVTGFLGVALTARRFLFLGFASCLASNLAMFAYYLYLQLPAPVLQQVGYTLISVYGLMYNWPQSAVENSEEGDGHRH